MGSQTGFDRFASAIADHVGRAWFFLACVLLVVAWVPTLFLMPVDSSQLIVNTTTTIVTFLLVALLQNTTARFERATNARLEALTAAIEGADDPVDDPAQKVGG